MAKFDVESNYRGLKAVMSIKTAAQPLPISLAQDEGILGMSLRNWSSHLAYHILASGAAASGAAASGAAASGATPSGATPSGATPSGAAPSGAALLGRHHLARHRLAPSV